MVKDSKRFADGHGWGYGEFEFDTATNTFRVGNLQDHPPQANDAKCGVVCHMAAEDRDYVFTKYAAR
jgi:Cytochrome P460